MATQGKLDVVGAGELLSSLLGAKGSIVLSILTMAQASAALSGVSLPDRGVIKGFVGLR